MPKSMNDPIQKSVTVPLSPAEAFSLFIENLGDWWPGETHSISARDKQKPRTITVEPHKDGQIMEETHDGTKVLWGRIIGWEHGKYVSFTWHPGADPDQATVVAVSFEDCPEGCRVDLTHGGFDVLGDLADAVSNSYLTGWDFVLGCYCGGATQLRVIA